MRGSTWSCVGGQHRLLHRLCLVFCIRPSIMHANRRTIRQSGGPWHGNLGDLLMQLTLR